jgi:hypothetical protein
MAEQKIPGKTAGKDEEEIATSDDLLVPLWKVFKVFSEGRLSSL